MLLKTKREKDVTLKEITDIFRRIDDINSRMDSAQTKKTIGGKLFTEYEDALKKESGSLAERQKKLKDVQLPESVRGADPNRLQTIQDDISRIRDKNRKTEGVLDKTESDIINLSISDKVLSNIEFVRRKFQAAREAQEGLLKKWLPDKYEKLTKDYEKVRESISRHKEALNSRKDTNQAAKDFKKTEDALKDLTERLTALAQKADRSEELHQKRLYILKGLREVCASLGFEDVGKPRYEKDGDFNSVVLHTVDTLNEGRVTFKLHLDNRIESDSGISLDACGDEFKKLSDLLKETYGVETAFKRVSQEEGPNRISKTEKPMPQSAPKTDRKHM